MQKELIVQCSATLKDIPPQAFYTLIMEAAAQMTHGLPVLGLVVTT